MRVPEELVCIHFFRQNPVFTSLHLKSSVHVVPPQETPPGRSADALRQGLRGPTAACWRSFQLRSAHPNGYRCSAMTLYIRASLRAAHRFQVPKTGQQEVGGGKGGIQAAGRRRHHPLVHLSMIHPATHAEECGWQLASLRRISSAQPSDRARRLHSAQCAGLCRQGSWLYSFLQDWPAERVSSDPCQPRGTCY